MGTCSEADAHQHRVDLDQSRSVWSLACSWDLRMIGLLLPSRGDSLPLCFSGAPGIIFITQWTFFTSFFSKSKTLCLPACSMEVESRSLYGQIWGDVEERGTRGQRTEGSPLLGRWETGMGMTQDLLSSAALRAEHRQTASFLESLTSGLSHPGLWCYFHTRVTREPEQR